MIIPCNLIYLKDIMQQTRHLPRSEEVKYEVHIKKGWLFREQLKATLFIDEKYFGYEILSKSHQQQNSLIMLPYSVIKSLLISSNKLTIKFYLEAKNQVPWVFYAENSQKARDIEKLIEERKVNILRGQETVINISSKRRENEKLEKSIDQPRCDIPKSGKQSLSEYLDSFDAKLNHLVHRLKIEVQSQEKQFQNEIWITSTNFLKISKLITNPALQLEKIEKERKEILMKLQNLRQI